MERKHDAVIAEALGYTFYAALRRDGSISRYICWPPELAPLPTKETDKAGFGYIELTIDEVALGLISGVRPMFGYLTAPTADSEWEVWRWAQENMDWFLALRQLIAGREGIVLATALDVFQEYKLGDFARALLEVIR